MSRKQGALRVASVAIAYAAATPAIAQDNALTSAVDAFGERAGIEQSGLYSESQVRGFDLNDSGAYRIDDAYFNRAAVLDDTVLAGAGVRVGVNAARLAYPAPSGVVTYRLREAGPVNELRLGAGVRDFGTQVAQGDGSYRKGAFSLAGGFLWRPLLRFAQGYEGKAFNAGAVAAWDIAPDRRLRVFGSMYRRDYDGDYVVAASGTAMPPALRRLHQYSPSWADTRALSTNYGVLYDAKFGGLRLDVSAFRSIFDIDNTDYTIISADAAGRATATTYRAAGRTRRADSVEARLGRQFDSDKSRHLGTLSLRGGRTTAELVSSLAVPLGAFQLPGDPPEVPEPRWSGTRGQDRVEQVTASAGYAFSWADRFQLRLGVHRTRYDKAVLSIAGAKSQRVSQSTNYNASAVFNLTDRAALFGSWVTGLEESGVAPTMASNRDEVLPPSEAEQREFGARYAFTPQLTFIGALFDVSKPSQGSRTDGSFGVVGDVRHRGVEASVAGKLNDRTSIVVGMARFESAVTGPLVDAGLVGSEGVGVSQQAAAASIEYRLRDGWSLDANLTYSGERWVDIANTLKAPAVATVGLGARRSFTLGGRPAALRILASNLTGEDGYLVARTGLLTPVSPRTLRAVLTVTWGSSE